MHSAPLHARESALVGIRSPLTLPEKRPLETVPTGIPGVDSLTGGLPRGGVTEVVGPASSGRTGLLLAILAQATATSEEACALVDASDALDPQSSMDSGVELSRLLWVRCYNFNQILKSSDLLLRSGGFGLVAVDLSDWPPEAISRMPRSCWLRFQRAIENTPTVLVVLNQEPSTAAWASLVLALETKDIRWSQAAGRGHPQTSLLHGMRLGVEVARSRTRKTHTHTSFELKTRWVL